MSGAVDIDVIITEITLLKEWTLLVNDQEEIEKNENDLADWKSGIVQ